MFFSSWMMTDHPRRRHFSRRHLLFSRLSEANPGYEKKEDMGTVFSLNQVWVCFVSMCVVIILLLVLKICLFWETCLRKLYGKPANRNRNRTPSQIYRKPSLKNSGDTTSLTTVVTPLRKNSGKKLRVRFSDDLESLSFSESKSWSDSVDYDVSSVSGVFMVNAQAAFSPYHLTYTTPNTSAGNEDNTNLFNCECSPVGDESDIHESALGSSYCTASHDLSDDQKDSGHCVDDDDNTSDTCDVKIDMYLGSSSMSSASTDSSASDCDKGIGSLDTSQCFITVDTNNDVTPWMRNIVEKTRRLSTPKIEQCTVDRPYLVQGNEQCTMDGSYLVQGNEQYTMDGSYLAAVNPNIRSSRSSACNLESSLMWDSYPYQEGADTSLSWDNFPLNGSKNTNDADDICI